MSPKYRCYVNSREQDIHEVRVSAAPINHVWPGFQRSQGQSEPGWFTTFDMAEPALVEVEVAGMEISSAEVRPAHAVREFQQNGHRISFVLERPQQVTLLVNGLHDALHIFANPPFEYEPKEGDIYFGPGEHDAGLILPRSGQRVCIDAGAVVHGSILIHEAENVTVTGRGVLDSSRIKCPKEAKAGEEGGEVMEAIAKLGFDFEKWLVGGNLVIYHSRNVKIEGIVLTDSPSWSVIARNGCRDLLFVNIKIVGQWRYNSDGIDICTSQDVTIRNCFIRSFDDCVVMRAPFLQGESEPVQNVVTEHCVLWCDWGKNLEIWCGEKRALVEDIVFRDLDLIHLTHYAISITTTYGSDSALVRKVLYEDIRICTEEFYPKPLFRIEDCPDYPLSQQENLPWLAVLNRGPMGRNLGNQHCEEATSLEGYHLRYQDITLKGVKIARRPLSILLKGEPPLLEIADVRIQDCDCSDICANSVENLNISKDGTAVSRILF